MSYLSKVNLYDLSNARRSPVTVIDVRPLASRVMPTIIKVCVFLYVENASLWALQCVGLCIGTSVASKMTRLRVHVLNISREMFINAIPTETKE